MMGDKSLKRLLMLQLRSNDTERLVIIAGIQHFPI